MASALLQFEPTAPRSTLVLVSDRAREYTRQAKAANTRRAYRSDWNDFDVWCTVHHLPSLPASANTVGLYLTALADQGRKASTIGRRVSSISQAHQAAGFESPTQTAAVRALLAGIRRTIGTAQTGKAPAVTEDIRAMVAGLPENLLGLRDRALLLVGFAGAFRRSELVGLDVSDLEFNRDGLTITLRRSKTDQEGEGRKVGIPYGSNPETCPVRSLRAWLDASAIEAGPVFRPVNRHGRMQPDRLSDKAVALVVKRRAEAAGLEPAKYAGHSLRSGLATAAAAAGASERAIMAQTGHRSVNMVRRYIRDGSLFRENAAARVGL
jgi:site-specific recombinase XerD